MIKIVQKESNKCKGDPSFHNFVKVSIFNFYFQFYYKILSMMVNYNLILEIERVEQVIEYKINVLL